MYNEINHFMTYGTYPVPVLVVKQKPCKFFFDIHYAELESSFDFLKLTGLIMYFNSSCRRNFQRPQGRVAPKRLDNTVNILRSVPEPVLFGRSRCKGPAPAPGSGSTLDKTDEILNDILFVCCNID